jgi:spoIIIJ-associated protein
VTASTDETGQLAAQALEYLQGLLKASELDVEAALTAHEGENVGLAITGPDAGLLVGQQGQTLNALQYLLQLMVNKGRDQRLRITVDADRYRARREQALTKFAHDLAAQVLGSGQEAITDPLNAMDRRIIHTALLDFPDVQTYSEGEEPNRYVVVSPRQNSS